MSQPQPELESLIQVVREIESHVATAGWDGPIRVYALVDAAEAIAADPSLAGELASPDHFLAIEQEGLPQADTLEDLLAQLAWPETVAGAAVVVERVVVPPEVEAELADVTDEAELLARLQGHPNAQDVRIAAGVLRSGQSWAALRARSADTDEDVAGGPDAVPGLIAALRSTLEP